jgi:hypothetical protein
MPSAHPSVLAERERRWYLPADEAHPEIDRDPQDASIGVVLPSPENFSPSSPAVSEEIYTGTPNERLNMLALDGSVWSCRTRGHCPMADLLELRTSLPQLDSGGGGIDGEIHGSRGAGRVRLRGRHPPPCSRGGRT